MHLLTARGYALSDVASALQKAIRRGDARLAGYWAIEMFTGGGKAPLGYKEYVWRRLLVVSAEDCAGLITREIVGLYEAWKLADKKRIFVAKAVVLLCQAHKSRDADHLTNLVYDLQAIDEAALEAELEAARAQPEPIPEYAYDCHTATGKKRGKTKRNFFLEEFDALTPRAPGLFDADLEGVRRGEVKLK